MTDPTAPLIARARAALAKGADPMAAAAMLPEMIAALEAGQQPHDYSLRPDLQRIVDHAKSAPRRDVERHRFVAAPGADVAALVEALRECTEITHKAYVSATMEAVNAGPSHPLQDNFDKWRVRCMNAETAARAALAAWEGRK